MKSREQLGFLTWPKVYSKESNGKTKLKFLTYKNRPSTMLGKQYRRAIQLTKFQQQYRESLTINDLLNDGYQVLCEKPSKQSFLKFTNRPPIARLQYGLESTLFSPGIHLIDQFPKHVKYFHSVDKINYDAMPKFVPSSQDKVFSDLALREKVKWRGSTSSISPTLSHFYFLISNLRPVNTHNLSPFFFKQTTSFPPAVRAPVSTILIPDNGTYAIDSHKFSEGNVILSKIGRSFERMVTMERSEFESCYLINSSDKIVPHNEVESFNYLKFGNFLLRSQLDCYDPQIGIFDLKSRATSPIRIFSGDDPSKHLSYRLNRIAGNTNSFEKEYYDMVRAAFLKYIFQARIGKMAGVFVAYHNTNEIFGVEFLTLDTMEQSIFQSKSMADFSFDMSLKLYDELLSRILENFGTQSNLTLGLIIHAKADNSLIAVAYPVELNSMGTYDIQIDFERGNLEKSCVSIPDGIVGFDIQVKVALDGCITKGALNMCDDNMPSLYYNIKKVSPSVIYDVYMNTCSELSIRKSVRTSNGTDNRNNNRNARQSIILPWNFSLDEKNGKIKNIIVSDKKEQKKSLDTNQSGTLNRYRKDIIDHKVMNQDQKNIIQNSNKVLNDLNKNIEDIIKKSGNDLNIGFEKTKNDESVNNNDNGKKLL